MTEPLCAGPAAVRHGDRHNSDGGLGTTPVLVTVGNQRADGVGHRAAAGHQLRGRGGRRAACC